MAFRQPWLGFPGWTFWVEWTYSRWLITIAVFHVTGPAAFLFFGWFTSSLLFGVAAGIIVGAPAAAKVGGRISSYLSYDQPITYLLGVVWAAFKLSRGYVDPGPSRIEIDQPEANRLSAGAARSIRVDRDTIRRLEAEVLAPIEITSVLDDPSWSRLR